MEAGTGAVAANWDDEDFELTSLLEDEEDFRHAPQKELADPDRPCHQATISRSSDLYAVGSRSIASAM